MVERDTSRSEVVVGWEDSLLCSESKLTTFPRCARFRGARSLTSFSSVEGFTSSLSISLSTVTVGVRDFKSNVCTV